MDVDYRKTKQLGAQNKFGQAFENLLSNQSTV